MEGRYRAEWGASNSTIILCNLLNWISSLLATGSAPNVKLFADNGHPHLILAANHRDYEIELWTSNLPKPPLTKYFSRDCVRRTANYRVYAVIYSADGSDEAEVEGEIRPFLQGVAPDWVAVMLTLKEVLSGYNHTGERIVRDAV